MRAFRRFLRSLAGLPRLPAEDEIAATVTLGGKARAFREPAFGRLQRILAAYRSLAAVEGGSQQANAQRVRIAYRLLALCFDGQRLGRVSTPELVGFVAALPDLLGLERHAPGNKPAAKADDFGSLYGHLSASFGWIYDDIDQHMTLSRLRGMRPYMLRNPPAHQLIAAFMGYEYVEPGDKLRRFFQHAIGRAH